MKIRIVDRIIAGILAVMLLGCFAAIICQFFFNIDLLGYAVKFFGNSEKTVYKVVVILVAVALLVFSSGCFSILFRHKGKKNQSVSQKTENGELTISMQTLETLVQKCLNEHSELSDTRIELNSDKKGLEIELYANIAGGISIPLTTSYLQKQIQQYITACSGVDVKEVRVHILHSVNEIDDAPFAIEGPAAIPLLKESNSTEKEETGIPVVSVTTEAVAETGDSEAAEEPEEERSSVFTGFCSTGEFCDTEDETKPLHQRIFSAPEQPCIVPCPPAEPETPEGNITEEVRPHPEDAQPVIPTEGFEETQENDNE